MHLGVALQTHQLRHRDRARFTHPPQVVAQQIDDHHVLGAVLGIADEIGGGGGIKIRVGAARPGALDRPRLHQALGAEQQKTLRRRRDHRLATGLS